MWPCEQFLSLTMFSGLIHVTCKVFHHFLWLNDNPLYSYNTTNSFLPLSVNILAFVNNAVVSVYIQVLLSIAAF